MVKISGTASGPCCRSAKCLWHDVPLPIPVLPLLSRVRAQPHTLPLLVPTGLPSVQSMMLIRDLSDHSCSPPAGQGGSGAAPGTARAGAGGTVPIVLLVEGAAHGQVTDKVQG